MIDKNPMYHEYQYDAGQVSLARQRVIDFLDFLTAHIKAQASRGSAFLVGDQLTAADAYWACFSNMLQSLPAAQNPMPDGLRRSWAVLAKSIDGYDPVLIHQRDMTYAQHLKLPLDF